MKQAFTLIIMLLCHLQIFGQAVSGKILDSENMALSYVQVFNVSNGQHVHSDENGAFILNEVLAGDTLKFILLGYETSQLVVDSLPSNISVMLKEEIVSLEAVVITPRINALNLISDIDIQTNPVNSSQDVLRQVPGLFIGQHAGGGKAEQIFLRGFDLDHGTDIAIAVDGLPVNMVSHAHGQGYADLHFVIPETIDRIDFGKGPYYANVGNFNTAGYVNFKLKEGLDRNSIKLESGQFNTQRVLSMWDLFNNDKQSAYLATEYLISDGPFESPQNFNRLNVFGRYTANISELDKVGITISHFNSKWDASGQIPQRAVDDGSITRFGAIDDTEGGETSRTNIQFDYTKFTSSNSYIKNQIFFSDYNFELFSNFTFFLEDTVNGDQIKQKEDRTIIGLNSEYNRSFSIENFDGSFQAGVGLRNDQSSDNELSHTRNRAETLEQIQFGDINETNLSTYIGLNINAGKWTFNPSTRLDHFEFQYNDGLLANYETQSTSRTLLSPKLNILFDYSQILQLYLKGGKGFHSNDTRLAVDQSKEEILPAAYGMDIGFVWKPTPHLLINTAFWNLFLEQEFVYVGDAGIVEPSGETTRRGVELSVRYQPAKWLFWNFDANYTHARTNDVDEGTDYIPLAPAFVLSNGFNAILSSGLYGGINLKYMADRPANEDNSIVAEGYSVWDLNLGYEMNSFNLGIQIQNVFDTEWNETQFATESRLQHEAESVEEIHFTPGTPFYLKGIVEYKF